MCGCKLGFGVSDHCAAHHTQSCGWRLRANGSTWRPHLFLSPGGPRTNRGLEWQKWNKLKSRAGTPGKSQLTPISRAGGSWVRVPKGPQVGEEKGKSSTAGGHG